MITLAIEVPPTEQPTNSADPTGGVQMPMQRLKVMTMPKCTGSMPRSPTTGRKIGVKIRSAGVMSMKVPISSRVMLIASRIISGLSDRLSSTSEMVLGIMPKAMARLIAIEAPIISSTTEVVTALSMMMRGRSRSEISRYQTSASTSA